MSKGKNSMLAVVGFGVTAILFIIFALSIRSTASKDLKPTFSLYSQAYLIVAAAFILWSIASAVGTRDVLAISVVIGDVLLLIATLFIVNILFETSTHKKWWLYGAALLGIVLLAVRTIFFYPKPYMIDEVLFFNSQRAVSFTISSVFLLIWLPVNLQIARLVTRRVQSMTMAYSALYAVATLSAIIFLLSKKPLALTLSFSALSVSFLVLIISCKYVSLVEERSHAERPAES